MKIDFQETTKDLATRIDIHSKFGARDIDQWMLDIIKLQPGLTILDVGCGSSRIIGALRPDSVAVDILFRKLRYARRFARQLIHGSGFYLPFTDESFPCVLCSQVIEHVSKDSPILDELERVLAPGGRLVLGTPDYDNWEWVYMEKLYGMFAPGGYADENIAHYSYRELVERFEKKRVSPGGNTLYSPRRNDPGL
jgi:ubiquinone/menaquinone biosynthesis C-methylase UbiE